MGFTIDMNGVKLLEFSPDHYLRGTGIVAVTNACASGSAGDFAGDVTVYRVENGPVPLAFEALIEGDEANLFLGSNRFRARHTIAVNESGGRILVG
ncbi:MAG: hypothetical protein ABGY96_17380, partial [bacterium]